jgi:hypothetical protein
VEQEIIEKTETKIKEILNQGINPNNLMHLYKLSKIRHLAKEDESMRYSNYGRDNYGRDSYGRRGYDTKYRGYDHLDRAAEHYGRYEASREEYNRGGNYGAKEDEMRNLEFMLESVCEFMSMLEREADTQDERALIKRYAKKMSEM